MDELGFNLTTEEIDGIKPGAVMTLEDGKVVIWYKDNTASVSYKCEA